jgi:hypothetical protein
VGILQSQQFNAADNGAAKNEKAPPAPGAKVFASFFKKKCFFSFVLF